MTPLGSGLAALNLGAHGVNVMPDPGVVVGVGHHRQRDGGRHAGREGAGVVAGEAAERNLLGNTTHNRHSEPVAVPLHSSAPGPNPGAQANNNRDDAAKQRRPVTGNKRKDLTPSAF